MTLERWFDNAIRYYDTRDWLRNAFAEITGDRVTGVCLAGALHHANLEMAMVEGWTERHIAACHLLSAICKEAYDDDDFPLVNDTILKGKADAVALLEKARARAAEQGI